MRRNSRLGVPALLASLLLLPAAALAQQARDVEPGRLYGNQLGCSSCHGLEAEGNHGPRLRDTRLPLRAFLRQVRAPRNAMPIYLRRDASDTELTAVYAWLRGDDAAAGPLPLRLELPPILKVSPGEAVEGTLVVGPADSETAASARYRVLLTRRDGAVLAGHRIEYRPEGQRRWTRVATDAEGAASLGPAGALALSAEGGDPIRFRLAGLPLGRYAILVEAFTPGPPPGQERLLGIASVPLVVW